MANFIVSYDLNGPKPSHDEVDKRMEKAGYTRARILETVWYVGADAEAHDIYNHVAPLFMEEDGLIVVKATDGVWDALLIENDELEKAWDEND